MEEVAIIVDLFEPFRVLAAVGEEFRAEVTNFYKSLTP